MNFPSRASVLTVGLALCVLAGAPGAIGPRIVQEKLVPRVEPGDHAPVRIWAGDAIQFECPECPQGSRYRILKIELLKEKLLARLGEIEGTEEVRRLVGYLPPAPGVSVPESPFPGLTLPTPLVDRGAPILTPPAAALFRSLGTTQIYAVTWELVDSEGVRQEFDPHIYAEPHAP